MMVSHSVVAATMLDDGSSIRELFVSCLQDGSIIQVFLPTFVVRMIQWLYQLVIAAVFYLTCSSAVKSSTTVNLTYSTYQGTARSDGISQWLGIRYAAPPVGNLRFAPPEDPIYVEGLQIADKHGKLCLATGESPYTQSTSEDCLFLDVYAPSDATPDSKLPVFFFIQGGGFNSNSNPDLDGSGLIAASNNSIVFVTINYRVGPYGFITGPSIRANNGLRDQRKALEWVQQYIANFGGDPNHVVLGGDSAGAASIALQLTAFGGQDMQLFHAAVAESTSFAPVLTNEESYYQTENFASNLGCSPNSTSSSADVLSCLRSKTTEELQAQNHNIPYPSEYSQSNFSTSAPPLYMWSPSIDGDIITDLTYNAFANGAYIDVPVIFGDDTNGGTIFTPRDTSTLTQSDQFLVNQFPFLRDDEIDIANEFYPNGNYSCSYVGESGCFWRQLSTAYGEMRYMCPTLYLSSIYASSSHSWNYRFNVEDPAQIAQGLGVPHTAEINAIFGPDGVSPGSAPNSYYPGGVNEQVVPVVMGYWASFIRSFDPNTYRYTGSARWETWTGTTNDLDGQRLVFQTGGATGMEDVNAVEGQRDRCLFWNAIGPDVRQR